jgi:uncharacterized membrane protein
LSDATAKAKSTEVVAADSNVDASRRIQRREFGALISIWSVLAIAMLFLAKENFSVPGLYYDEALFAGMAKDFLTGQIHGQHIPNHEVAEIFGRPFPIFVQSYLGALKSWMLMPALSLFGFDVPVVRMATLCWGLVVLLFLMLGTWRWLGLRAGLLVGPLLAFDPAYFFLCLLDWGAAIPSLLCRCLCFYLAVLWWRRREGRYAFLAAFFAGLGFFNKIDFAILLIGVPIAGLLCFGRPRLASLRAQSLAGALSCLGFLLGAGPMLLKVPGILGFGFFGVSSSGPGEASEKLHTMLALYDGSYFYRLMSAGGVFERMFSEPANTLPILGSAVVIASVTCISMNTRTSKSAGTRAGLFLVLATILVTLGVIFLPEAVRIHHAVLVFPFPQLIIAMAASSFLATPVSSGKIRRALATLMWPAMGALLLWQVLAIARTQELIRETGGRGRWSESFDTFCHENKTRSDLIMVSLDWGFNEQLIFLTNGPRLIEPFWKFGKGAPSLPSDANYLYLVHPTEYSVFPFGVDYLSKAKMRVGEVEIRPYFDRQNRVAFYTIQFTRH